MQHETSTEFNVTALDGWSFVHAAFGLVFGLVRVPRFIAYGLIIATEVVEMILRKTLPFFRESAVNVAADLTIGIVSYEVGRAFTGRIIAAT